MIKWLKHHLADHAAAWLLAKKPNRPGGLIGPDHFLAARADRSYPRMGIYATQEQVGDPDLSPFYLFPDTCIMPTSPYLFTGRISRGPRYGTLPQHTGQRV